MKHFWLLFFSECKGIIISYKKLIYIILIPCCLFLFLGIIFKNASPKDLPVGYIDRDQSPLSLQLLRMLDATPSIALSESITDENQAKIKLHSQEIYGLIEIPSNFQKKILQGKRQEVVGYFNGQLMMAAGMISKDFQTTIGTFSAGISLKKTLQKGTQTHKAYAEARPILIEEHTLYNPFSNNAYLLLTAFFPMILQMVVLLSTIYVVGVEFRYQRGKIWLEKSGNKPAVALLSKLLPYTLVFFAVGWWMNFLLFERIGTPAQAPLFSAVVSSWILVVVYQGIGVIIASVSRDFRMALTIGSGFASLAFSFSAYTFPKEGFPEILQYVSQIFPFTHFLEFYLNRMIKGIDFQITWRPFFSLLAFGIFIMIGYFRFIKALQTGGYEKN